MATIETHNELKRWLNEQPRPVRVATAARAALRVLPFVTHVDRPNSPQEPPAFLTVRCILTSGVAAKMPTHEISAAAAVAFELARVSAYAPDAPANAARAAARAAAYAARAATVFGAAVVHGAIRSPAHAVRAARAAAGDASEDAARSVVYSDTERDLRNLMTAPIWDDLKEPDWLVERLLSNSNILDSGPEWAFWRR